MKVIDRKITLCAFAILFLGAIMFFTYMEPISAASSSLAYIKGNASKGSAAANEFNNVTKQLYDLVQKIGCVIMIIAVVRFGVSLTTDSPQELSKGSGMLAAGAILANIKTLLGSFSGGSAGLDKLIKNVTLVAQSVGVIIAIYGVISLGLGITQDNAGEQVRGVKFLIGGAIVAGLITVAKWFGVII